MNQTVLLATFINERRKVSSVLKLIAKHFNVINTKVFLLKDTNSDNYILTYNIQKDHDIVFSDVIHNTISLHRKKETNTLYTLNALNAIIMDQNNGNLDSRFAVDWEEYRDSIVLTRGIGESDDNEELVELRKISTEVAKIFNLRKEED